jgi:rhodanese-related sulfurtransferase
VPVVDVRTPAEWLETGVVAGSRLHTFFDEHGRYDLDSWMSAMGEVAGPQDPVVLICRSGNRSLTIARYLDRKAGYRRIYNVRQGIRGWIRDGKPTQPPVPTSS